MGIDNKKTYAITVKSVWWIDNRDCFESVYHILYFPKSDAAIHVCIREDNSDVEQDVCITTPDGIEEIKNILQKDSFYWKSNLINEENIQVKALTGDICDDRWIESLPPSYDTLWSYLGEYDGLIRSFTHEDDALSIGHGLDCHCLNKETGDFFMGLACFGASSLTRFFIKDGDGYVEVVLDTNFNKQYYLGKTIHKKEALAWLESANKILAKQKTLCGRIKNLCR